MNIQNEKKDEKQGKPRTKFEENRNHSDEREHSGEHLSQAVENACHAAGFAPEQKIGAKAQFLNRRLFELHVLDSLHFFRKQLPKATVSCRIDMSLERLRCKAVYSTKANAGDSENAKEHYPIFRRLRCKQSVHDVSGHQNANIRHDRAK